MMSSNKEKFNREKNGQWVEHEKKSMTGLANKEREYFHYFKYIFSVYRTKGIINNSAYVSVCNIANSSAERTVSLEPRARWCDELFIQALTGLGEYA